MDQSNLDLGVFQDTKISGRVHTRESTKVSVRVHTRESAVYHLLKVDMKSRHPGGVSIFYCNAPHLQVE